MIRSCLPARAGLGFKPQHYQDALDAPGALGFFEVHAENYMGAGGAPHAMLERLHRDHALSVHGVGLSIGGAGPLDPDHLARLETLLGQMHQVFIDHVKARRGDRLSTDTDLFDGRFWLGAEAVRLGLADGIGHPVPVLKARYGDKVRLRVFGQRRSMAQRLGLAQIARDAAAEALASADEAALWARLGL